MYQHITHKERGIIAHLLARKRTYSDIARALGVHRSTISRVEKRKRVGDWEGDTIVGAEKTERILTHVDRMSGLLVASRTQADSDSVRHATARSMRTLPCNTITYDNGSEFAAFECIEKETKAKVYFARPGHPEERPINENTNGLLRQFFPKGSSFATVTQRDVDEAAAMINNRPRKRLGYRTPLEVFCSASVRCTRDFTVRSRFSNIAF